MASRLDAAGSSAYTDLGGLNALRSSAAKPDTQTINKVAKQFESMYIGLMLSAMREADQAFAEDDIFSSEETRFYQDMLDKQMAVTMAEGRGIGLAEVIARQMGADSGTAETVRPLNSPLPVRPEAVGNPLPVHPAELPRPVARPEQVVTPVRTESSASVSAVAGASVASTTSPLVAHDAAALDGSPEAFVKVMLPYAKEAAARIGVHPKVLLAQAALETGWGKSLKGNSMNLFGIKADSAWQGSSVRLPTLEFRNGALQQEKASFRAYGSAADSFHDYVSFLQNNPRYKEALRSVSEPRAFVSALSNAGYATDPQYEKKLARILNSDWLAGVPDTKG